MNKKLLTIIFVTCFFFSVVFVSQISYCQTATPTPTETPEQGSPLNLLFIFGIMVVLVVAIGVISAFFVVKRRVNEKSLKRYSSSKFQDWVIKKFNGKPSDPSSGVNGFTEGGQPVLIKQSDVSLAEVEDFVKLLVKGKAQKGVIAAFNFDKDTIEGKLKAMDNGVELQLLPITELLNKRYSSRIKSLARSPVTFEAPLTIMAQDQVVAETRPFEKMPDIPPKKRSKTPYLYIKQQHESR